jgi:VIT1/CCC1 family predicted Fe2+/Mn2+ transporter
LLAAIFIHSSFWRIVSVAVASTLALLVFGAVGAYLGGAHKVRAAIRVLIGGWLAFAITYGVGKLFGTGAA